MKIYVASSWRNVRQGVVVAALRDAGHEVYDFRNPRPGSDGFHWSDLNEVDGFNADKEDWTPAQFRDALQHPIARAGYQSDIDALKAADAVVLVLPCGRSSHLELGWASGHGKLTAVLLEGDLEPELMYKMVNRLCLSLDEVVETMDRWHNWRY